MGINDVTINSPIFDSTWIVNGKQLYRYKLSGSYSVSALGTYPVKVIAQNPTPEGCSGEQEIDYDLQVFEPPVANFNFSTSGCASDSVRFTDNSNTFGRSSIKWFWDFADGKNSQLRNPAHLYTTAGNYNVKFFMVTDIGCLS
ncbi:MAG: PKD domain-containing protein, partial [Bacteroidota bacterium]|nr:PKD domain-containing protein [Bacteroidota bacterium]